MPVGDNNNNQQILVTLLQSINAKVDEIYSKVDNVSTRITVIESQKTQESVAKLIDSVQNAKDRLTVIETRGSTKDNIMTGVISTVISVGLLIVAKFLEFIK